MDGPDVAREHRSARSTIACAIRSGGSACRRTRHSASDRILDFHDVGIDEIVPLRGRAFAAGNDAWRGQRGNPRPLVPRRGQRARHARSRRPAWCSISACSTAAWPRCGRCSTTSSSTRSRRWAADAGKSLALHLGARSACRQDDPRQRPSRQLQRELHLFRAADVSEVDGSRQNTEIGSMDMHRGPQGAARPGSRRCATTSARPSSSSRTTRPPRSIRARPAASCARRGSAPITPAPTAAAA